MFPAEPLLIKPGFVWFSISISFSNSSDCLSVCFYRLGFRNEYYDYYCIFFTSWYLHLNQSQSSCFRSWSQSLLSILHRQSLHLFFSLSLSCKLAVFEIFFFDYFDCLANEQTNNLCFSEIVFSGGVLSSEFSKKWLIVCPNWVLYRFNVSLFESVLLSLLWIQTIGVGLLCISAHAKVILDR